MNTLCRQVRSGDGIADTATRGPLPFFRRRSYDVKRPLRDDPSTSSVSGMSYTCRSDRRGMRRASALDGRGTEVPRFSLQLVRGIKIRLYIPFPWHDPCRREERSPPRMCALDL